MKVRKDLDDDIVLIANRLAMNLSLDCDVFLIHDLIREFCINNHFKPTEIKTRTENGCLFINDKCIDRVEPLLKAYPFDEKSYYLANEILARGEG